MIIWDLFLILKYTVHKVYILLMIKLLWSVIRLYRYLCVCFVIASIYTNTSRYTNLHNTFYYKPILIICIKLKKKSMYKSKTYLTKKIFVKNKVVLMKCHQHVSNICNFFNFFSKSISFLYFIHILSPGGNQ